MRHFLILFIAGLCLATFGCSQGSTPITPEMMEGQSAKTTAQTHLWGYYDVYIDIESQTVEAVPNREAMYTANVVTFLNANPAGLGFYINGTPIGSDYIDVDIDVTITHPFPSQPQYNGYDVRGVFMGDGSAALDYNPDLKYPMLYTDQLMLADPVDELGGPDGYTRWFNRTEFSGNTLPIVQYTPGIMAAPNFNGNATLNAYKYFTDGLTATGDLWTWLKTHPSQHGIFSSGAANTRNYYLRFPNTKGIMYGYAVLANWQGVAPTDHPSNAPEAVACSVVDGSDVYYISSTNNGGNLKLDVSLWDWDATVSPTGVMTDYKLFVESTVLVSVHQFTVSEMTPTGGNENYSTYHVEIPADNINGTNNNEYWVIVEEQNTDYTNDFGVTNLAGTDPLAACFRYNLTLVNPPPNNPPVITGITDDIPPDGLNTTVDITNTAVTYTAIYTDPDTGQNHTFQWYIEPASETNPSDPPDGMPYNWMPKAPGDYKIWVKVDDGFGPVLGGPWIVTRIPDPGWAKTWGGTMNDRGSSVATDSSGNIYVTGYFQNTVDFDPGSGTDNRASNGSADIFLSKFDASGSFLWVKTWGGVLGDVGFSVTTDGSNNVYVIGNFQSVVDFDPGTGTDNHSSNGSADIFLSKFDSSGSFLWAKTWGSTLMDGGFGVVADSLGNVYVTGYFQSTVDFDPGAGADNHTSSGIQDAFLSKFDSSGSFFWAKTWGWIGDDCGYGVATDGSNNVYITGYFEGTVDFDPSAGVDNHTYINGCIFLSKFNSAGSFQWAQTWGGDLFSDCGYSVATDGSNVYVTGFFEGTGDFDPGAGTDNHISTGGRDIFLSKFDSSGSFLWAKTWGGIIDDYGRGVALDGSGNVYTTGDFQSTVDFDPGAGVDNYSSNGMEDIFLSKFDSSGSFLWAKTWGGTLNDYGRSVASSSSNSIYTTGDFQSTVDFDPGAGVDNHTSNGGTDVFLSKFPPG